MESHKRNDLTPPVLMLCPHGYTGLSYYIYALCRHLSEAGTEVELITSDPWIPDTYPSPFSINKAYRHISGPRSRARKGMAYLRSTHRARQALAQSSAPVFHMQISELPLVDAWLMRQARRMGKRVVFTPHDIVHTKRYPGGHQMLQKCFNAAHAIVVHNEINARDICQRYKVEARHVHVIPHGNYAWRIRSRESRQEACQRLGLEDHRLWLLFFGDIRPSKGLDVLCRAVPALVKQHPDARLLIAGRLSHGLNPAWLDGLLRDSGCAEWTECRLGFIPDDQIVSYYQAASLVVMPYHSISESGVLRFAHSAGAVPVCSDLPEFRETIVDGKNGFLFQPGNSGECARVISRALAMKDDPGLHRAIEETDRRFDWSEVALRTQHVYREVVSI